MKVNTKEKMLKVLDKINDKKTAITAGTAAVAPALLSVSAFAAEGGSSSYTAPNVAESVTSEMLGQVLTQMTNLLPVVLPVVVACLAFRKGISFLRGMIAGA